MTIRELLDELDGIADEELDSPVFAAVNEGIFEISIISRCIKGTDEVPAGAMLIVVL